MISVHNYRNDDFIEHQESYDFLNHGLKNRTISFVVDRRVNYIRSRIQLFKPRFKEL